MVDCTDKNNSAIELVKHLLKVWDNGDVELFNKIADSSIVYIKNDYQYIGYEKVFGYVTHVQKFASDVKVEVTNVAGNENEAFAEWIMTGKQVKPIEGIISVATNKEFTLKGVTLIKVENNKIVRAVDYFDVLEFLLQLGSKVDLPGETTLP